LDKKSKSHHTVFINQTFELPSISSYPSGTMKGSFFFPLALAIALYLPSSEATTPHGYLRTPRMLEEEEAETTTESVATAEVVATNDTSVDAAVDPESSGKRTVGRVKIPHTPYSFSRITYGTLHFPQFECE